MYFSIFSFLKDLVFKNFALKVISLLLALVLWFVLSSAQGVEKIVEAPVVIVNKPQNLGISSDYVKSVLVQLKSTPLAPKDFAKNLTVTLDLKNSLPGDKVFNLSKKNLNLPTGVEVINIRPSTIALKLEKLERKKVPVVVRYSGIPARGYEITNIFVSPKSIEVEGPSSKVFKVKSVFTETIDIEGLKNSLERDNVNVVINSKYINFVDSGKVKVIFKIEEKKFSKYFRNIRIKFINSKRRYRVNRLYVDALLKIPISLKGKIEKTDVDVIADLSSVKVYRKYVYVKLKGFCKKFSNRVVVDKIFPQKVRVKLY